MLEGFSRPASLRNTNSTDAEVSTATGNVTCTVRVVAFVVGSTVTAVPFTRTVEASMLAGTVVPEGKVTVKVSPTRSAPFEPVLKVSVYAAEAETVSGLIVTTGEVSVVEVEMIV